MLAHRRKVASLILSRSGSVFLFLGVLPYFRFYAFSWLSCPFVSAFYSSRCY